MNLIPKTKAAQILGITKQRIQQFENKTPRPDYFVINDKTGRYQVDIDNLCWKELVKKYEYQEDNPLKSDNTEKKYTPGSLEQKAREALLNEQIYDAKIKEEKSKQEELKTLEKMKSLAPIDLIKHFFSFSENMIQRIYRRPYEIDPQLSALYIGGENQKAVQLLIRELEGIVKDTQKELLNAIKEEGYKIK